jgi:hypothetical protein
MMQTDVKATHLDADGVVYAGPTRVKGYAFTSGGTAGEIIFYDNASAASGTTRLTINISTNQAPGSMTIPGEGIKFDNGVYVDIPANAHITVFYG